MKEFTIDVAPGGNVLALYDDELIELFRALGQPNIERASHVEPTPSGQWIADMTPAIQRFHLECDNPILGPFATRAEALEKEHDWLVEKLFGGSRE